VGAVFSRVEGFTTLAGLAPALIFHTVCMFFGTALIGAAKKKSQAAATEPA